MVESDSLVVELSSSEHTIKESIFYVIAFTDKSLNLNLYRLLWKVRNILIKG